MMSHRGKRQAFRSDDVTPGKQSRTVLLQGIGTIQYFTFARILQQRRGGKGALRRLRKKKKRPPWINVSRIPVPPYPPI